MRTKTIHPPVRPTQSLVKLAAAAGLAGLVCSSAASAQTTPPSSGNRVTGLDISAWQGNWSTTTWATLHRPTNQSVNGVFGDGRDFVYIRSSRGGTSGYYDQNDSANNNNLNTLSQRYDDPYFVQNITRATAAGMLAGPYHFGRMDIIASTKNANGIPNNGTDEADHFIQMAGAWMRPGYLLPVFDFEAGLSQRTATELAQFAIDFSNRIFAVKGIRPSVYIGNNYASPMNSIALSSTVVSSMPGLWSARWPNQTDPNSIPIQTANPGDYTSTVYGPWDNAPNPAHPWDFWQYASTGKLNAYSGNLDLDVAHGDIEFVKDFLTPALWISSISGNWKDLANWNSGETPVAPVQGPGQVARVGTMVLPTARMPGQPGATGVTGQDDTVNLNRPSENITVTIDSTTPTINIRRLILAERLNVTGSALNVRLTGTVNAGGTLSVSGGTTTIDQLVFDAGSSLEFAGGGNLNVASAVLNTDVTFNGASGTGSLGVKAGVLTPSLSLGGGTRTFTVGNGTAATDLRVTLPLSNGNLVKQGLGTLELTGNNAAFAGVVTVANGYLSLTANNQLGPAGVTTTQTATQGGTVRLSGDGLNYGVPITIGGSGSAVGSSSFGALENVSGNNTWSGAITLAGDQGNLGQANLNQINATAGTLTLSGVIQNAGSLALASWAKTGTGDVVLTGGSPNTFTNLTRVFAGRLILEKDGALGTAGSSTIAEGNTFVPAGSVATIAFRAPASSPAGFNYNAVEWIHTEGTGVAGFGQIDNLGGANTFAGHLGLGGPVVGSVRESSIGVTAGSLEIKGGLYARATVDEARNINKLGVGTLILSGDSGPAPTNGSDKSLINSTFNVTAGTVQLNGTAGNTANVPGVTTWNVNGASSKLTVAKTNAAGNAAIALNGGTLQATANVTTSNALSLPGAGTVDTAAGANVNVTTLANGTGKTLTKTGAGTLSLTGTQTHAAGAALVVQAGTVNLNTNAGSNASPLLAVSNTGGAVNFNAREDLAGLTLNGAGSTAALTAGGSKVLNTGTLSLLNSPKLDLTNNAMVVRSASLSTVADYLKTGFAAGAWNGPGVNSTVAAADASRATALGFATSGALGQTSFKGVTGLTGNEVLVAYTYYGDANLDGKVDVGDLGLLAGAWQESGKFWFDGDFTYDGTVDIGDLGLLAANWQKDVGSGQLLMSFDQAMAQFAAFDGVAVPEPACAVAALGVLALAAGARRRRRRGRPRLDI